MQSYNNDLKAFVWMNYLLKLHYVQAGQFKITISKRLIKDKPTNSIKIIVQVHYFNAPTTEKRINFLQEPISVRFAYYN